MSSPTAYHQLGKFIVDFQYLEEAVDDLLELLVDADSEAIKILAHELEYSKRLKTADAIFSRFVDIRMNTDKLKKDEFHKLMVCLGKLGERRNELVHSKYNPWKNVDGNQGLLRRNSKLERQGSGLKTNEEELQPDAFDGDLADLRNAAQSLEVFRSAIIDYVYS